MFSGIVDHCGQIKSLRKEPDSLHLEIGTEFTDLVPGESIAVDGICLTVTESTDAGFRCDLSCETLAVTTSGSWELGKRLNLERALKLNERLGGHLVLGHVDSQGVVRNRIERDDFIEFSISTASGSGLLVPKGSIAMNGVSLTINLLERDSFSVLTIPHTLERTSLGELQVGDRVNLEFDYLAKIVQAQCGLYLGREKHE